MMDKNSSSTDKVTKGTRSSAKQGVIDATEHYVEVLDGAWEADQKTKADFYERIRILIQYQFALKAPTPIIRAMVVRDMEEMNSKDGTKSSGIYLPLALQKKVDIVSKQLGSTANETASLVLAEHIKDYAKDKRLLETVEDEEGEENENKRDGFGI
jgi:hypothetical protein